MSNSNAEYYKSISLAWAELAIYNFWLFYDHDDMEGSRTDLNEILMEDLDNPF